MLCSCSRIATDGDGWRQTGFTVRLTSQGHITQQSVQTQREGSGLAIQADDRCRREVRLEQEVAGERVQVVLCDRDGCRRDVQPGDL